MRDATTHGYEPEEYVNSPLNLDLLRCIKYAVRESDNGRGRKAYEVIRYNPIGQGWHVAKYDHEDAANAVAAVLQAFSDWEVH